MDHSHDHGHMDHGHGDMDMGHKCNMNMLFTWDTTDLCIVFRGWHVSGTWTLLLSLLGIIALTAGYEAVREASRRYEAHAATKRENSIARSGRARKDDEQKTKIIKAFFYAVQIFYSFFIMLLFMTYNGWVMISVAIGAFIGYLLFSSNSPATKSAACH